MLYCELYTSTFLHYSFSTRIHLYAFTPIPLYASTPLHLYASTSLRLYTSMALHLYTTLSWYIFLYTFFAAHFLRFYAFTSRNVTTTKLNVSTVLIYTMLFLYAVF